MAIGTVFAMGNGGALPFLTIYFSDILEATIGLYNGSPESKIAVDESVRKGKLHTLIMCSQIVS